MSSLPFIYLRMELVQLEFVLHSAEIVASETHWSAYDSSEVFQK